MAVGYLAYTEQLPIPLSQDYDLHTLPANPLMDIWFAWDSTWYQMLVEQGYQTAAEVPQGPVPVQANWAFFPLYPWLSAMLSSATGWPSEVSLLLVANVAFVFAIYLVYCEVQELHNERTAQLAAFLLLAWPGTHFFSSAYTESLFLLIVVGVFRLARQERFLWAALVAALGALTRSPGIMLVFPIAFYAWSTWAGKNKSRQNIRTGFIFVFSGAGARTFLICCIPLAALSCFMAYLYTLTGDPLAFATVQEAWGRGARNPILEFIRPFVALSTIPAEQWMDFMTMWLIPIPLLLLLRERSWPHFSFAFILVLLAITAGVVSLNRQTLVIFPIIVVLSKWLASNPKASRILVPAVACAGLLMMAFWSAGYGVV
ncbi:MAG: glycosyltransferase family 39 protein [Pseudomonadota bacterium]